MNPTTCNAYSHVYIPRSLKQKHVHPQNENLTRDVIRLTSRLEIQELHMRTLGNTSHVETSTLDDVTVLVKRLVDESAQQNLTHMKYRKDIELLKTESAEQEVKIIDQKTESAQHYSRQQLAVDSLTRYVNSMTSDVTSLTRDVTSMRACTAPRVAFSAGLTSGATTVGDRETVVYPRLLQSSGGGYDTSTGVFTCPEAGLYYFTVTAMSGPGKSVCLDLRPNGDWVTRLVAGDKDFRDSVLISN